MSKHGLVQKEKKRYMEKRNVEREKKYGYKEINKILKKIRDRSGENSASGEWKAGDLYLLMKREDFIYKAFSQIQRNKGIDTKGVDRKGMDGFGKEDLDGIRKELIERRFVSLPVRRVYIPKPGKRKRRPLGIPTLKDKIVQQMVYSILEAVFEPKFKNEDGNTNFGFRKDKGVKDAMDLIKRKGKSMRWCIEGDIEGAYDNVDHQRMIEALEERIEDKRFISIVTGMLKAGRKEKGISIKSNLGTPQGGIVSPMLFNIYMSALDSKMEELRQEQEKEETKKKKAEYRRRDYDKISNEIGTDVRWIKRLKEKKGTDGTEWTEKEKKEYKERKKNIKKRSQEREKKSSIDQKVQRRRQLFVRYADDWIWLTNGTYEEAVRKKDWISNFLEKELKLKLSEEKTKITDLNEEKMKFLGFELGYNKTLKKRRIKTDEYGRSRRTTGQTLNVGIDERRYRSKYETLKIIKGDWKGVAWDAMTIKPTYEIIERYNQTIRGLIGYWAQGVAEYEKIAKPLWAIELSCKLTLAKKHRLKRKGMRQKFGTRTELNDEKRGTIKLMQYQDRKEMFDELKRKPKRQETEGNIYNNWRTRYKLNKECVICGSEENTEMHHIKKIKGIKAKGFEKIMVSLNRKQITVCKKCHGRIHKGDYDGKKLTELYDIETAKL